MYPYPDNPFPMPRRPVYGGRGMVATTQPLAAQAGLDMLKQGGNAVDAAVAAAACLTVTEPVSNGIGGDAFALVWQEGRLYGLNASGPAPQAASIDRLLALGYTGMPRRGLHAITVPGVPAAWAMLNSRFGSLSLESALAPAVNYAAQGFPLSPAIGRYWQFFLDHDAPGLIGPEFQGWFDTFAQGGQLYPGKVITLPDHAATLAEIGASQGRAFYEGDLADHIDAFMRAHGGLLRKSDLAQYQAEWVEPISCRYHGYDVWEIPPNGQGLVALMALNILDNFSLEERNAQAMHLQMEATKLAFSDGLAYITDPRYLRQPLADFLGKDYGQKRAALIGPAAAPCQARPMGGGTVYLCTADAEGNMVSYIQSNFDDFGSGVVVPGTGINLQNRGSSFQLDPAHNNALLPGKRTYHTIIPGFLTKDGQAQGPFGVMGAYMQPQGHLQTVCNLVDFGLDPQAALDAPRWQWLREKKFKAETRLPLEIREQLLAKGHDLAADANSYGFGRGQIILRDPDSGVLAGGTDSRSDGVVAAW